MIFLPMIVFLNYEWIVIAAQLFYYVSIILEI